MKLSELLTDESKWVKNMDEGRRTADGLTACDSNGNCWCLLGAANKVSGDPNDAFRLRCKIRDAVRKLFPEGPWIEKGDYVGIATFNDAPQTTFADVQAVIREVEAS